MKNDIHHRYHLLAGPFTGNEASLLEAVCAYLKKTGARIIQHPNPGYGTDIYRLRSECETMEETEARLRRTGKSIP